MNNVTFKDVVAATVVLGAIGACNFGAGAGVGALVALVASGPIAATAIVFGAVALASAVSIGSEHVFAYMGASPATAKFLSTALVVAGLSAGCFALINICAYSAPVVLGIGGTIIALNLLGGAFNTYNAYKLANPY